MLISLSEKNFKNLEAEIEIIVTSKSDLEKCEDKEILEKLNFKASDEETCFLVQNNKIYVGYEDDSYDSYAIAISAAIKVIKSTNFASAKVKLLKDEELSLKAFVEGATMGAYKFDTYKSEKKETAKLSLIVDCKKLSTSLVNILEDSIIIADSVNKVRDFVNTTPADFYPEVMAKEAKKIAKETKISIKVHGEKYLQKNAMHTMLAVGRASIHESKLIHLTYKPKDAKIKIALVGKGLTYDSGGLSLKPAASMVTMKSDKGGGCAVLGIMEAVAKLNLPIEVHGIVGAVENMIGGDAYKPDDVLVAKNGKTIEIRNTDAEGRLVLADCLCYAQEKLPDLDYIFDFATLTGAAVVGVGHYTTAIMGNSTALRCKAIANSLRAGEYATSLPFNRYLKKSIKSNIADICNISSTRYGGAITAGMFLDNFIEEKNKDKWLHFDIAGPAFVEHVWGYNPHGASGAGVRMTVEFIKTLSLSQDEKKTSCHSKK